jgi:Rrf2 family protein
MLKVSRKTEYALIVLQHISQCAADQRVQVTEIAEEHDLPRELLAKVMQRMKRVGLLTSTKGVAGGYQLSRPLGETRFIDVVRPFEDNLALVECMDDKASRCQRHDCCSLRNPMMVLNGWLMRQFSQLTMDEFIRMRPPAPCPDDDVSRVPIASLMMSRSPNPAPPPPVAASPGPSAGPAEGPPLGTGTT